MYVQKSMPKGKTGILDAVERKWKRLCGGPPKSSKLSLLQEFFKRSQQFTTFLLANFEFTECCLSIEYRIGQNNECISYHVYYLFSVAVDFRLQSLYFKFKVERYRKLSCFPLHFYSRAPNFISQLRFQRLRMEPGQGVNSSVLLIIMHSLDGNMYSEIYLDIFLVICGKFDNQVCKLEIFQDLKILLFYLCSK